MYLKFKLNIIKKIIYILGARCLGVRGKKKMTMNGEYPKVFPVSEYKTYYLIILMITIKEKIY